MKKALTLALSVILALAMMLCSSALVLDTASSAANATWNCFSCPCGHTLRK